MNTVSSSSPAVPDEIIRKKKFAILICGVILYFLTCMAKGLVPGIIYNDLLKAGLSSEMIAVSICIRKGATIGSASQRSLKTETP